MKPSSNWVNRMPARLASRNAVTTLVSDEFDAVTFNTESPSTTPRQGPRFLSMNWMSRTGRPFVEVYGIDWTGFVESMHQVITSANSTSRLFSVSDFAAAWTMAVTSRISW